MSKQEDKNGKFEQSWKSAFSGTEVTPPANVWSEIDHGLTQTQLSTLQQKTAVYKWTAAAAVIFAASLGVMALSINYQQIAGWFGVETGESNRERVAQLEEENKVDSGNYAGFSILRNDFSGAESKVSALPASDEKQGVEVASGVLKEPSISPKTTHTYVASRRKDDFSLGHEPVSGFLEKDLSLFSHYDSRTALATLAGRPVDNLLAVNAPELASFGVNGVMMNEIMRPFLNAEAKTRFWSGVDIASGYFNPNYGPGTYITSQELLTKDVGSREPVPELSENMRGGTSYSVGINFGMELKNRWSIEVGALYSLLGARTFTNLILESDGFSDAVAYSSEIAGLESVTNLVESELTKLSVDDIQINNTFQFISIPVQAGYRLIDRRFNLTVNGGLAANLYLGNRLRGRQNFSSFELEPGRRSPYRSLTIAAVTGFEIGYWIHRRVNLSFEPSYQKNLQSLTKDDAGFVANPSGVGVQIGFKYDF